MTEAIRTGIVDKNGGNVLASVVQTTADPTKNGLVIVNPDGSSLSSTLSSTCLKLNQTTPQSVINWAPIFNEWIKTGQLDWSHWANITTYATLWAELVAVPPLTWTVFTRGNWTLTSWRDATNNNDTNLNKNAAGVTTATLNTVAPTIGKTYKIVTTVWAISWGTFSWQRWGVGWTVLLSASTFTSYITAITAWPLTYTPSASAMTGTITAVSIKEVTSWTWSITIEKDLKIWGDFMKPNWQVFLRAADNGWVQLAQSWASSTFGWAVSIVWALSWATTIGSSGTNTNTQTAVGVRADSTNAFSSQNTTASTALLPIQVPARTSWFWNAWDTANRTITWFQNMMLHAQTTIASRFRWWYTDASSVTSEVMNLTNGWTLNVLWTTLWTESLTNPNLTSGTSWTQTGDVALTGDAATYTYSTGAGTLTQASASLAVPLVWSRWYKLVFTTTGNSTTWPTIYIPATVAVDVTQIAEWVNWTYNMWFKTINSPTNFILNFMSAAAGTVTIDTLSLKEVSGWTIMVDNVTTKAISASSDSILWSVNYGVDAWANDTYTANISPAPTGYITWAQYILKANTANTWAASVNFNSLWAKTIVKWVSTALSNNDILANMYCLLVYDGTNMVLMNPRAL